VASLLSLIALLLGHPATAGRICFLVDGLPKAKIDSHATPSIYEMASKQFKLGSPSPSAFSILRLE
jgi:hypothetical protein